MQANESPPSVHPNEQLVLLTQTLVQVRDDLLVWEHRFSGIQDDAASSFREAHVELSILVRRCCGDAFPGTSAKLYTQSGVQIDSVAEFGPALAGAASRIASANARVNLILSIVKELAEGWRDHADIIEEDAPCAAWALRHVVVSLLIASRHRGWSEIPFNEDLRAAACIALAGNRRMDSRGGRAARPDCEGIRGPGFGGQRGLRPIAPTGSWFAMCRSGASVLPEFCATGQSMIH